METLETLSFIIWLLGLIPSWMGGWKLGEGEYAIGIGFIASSFALILTSMALDTIIIIILETLQKVSQ